MLRDIQSAIRMLVREPGFAAIVVLTLALGIGANTAIFSVVNSVLLRPLQFHEPGRLVAVNEVVPKIAHLYPMLPVNLSHYFDWRKQSTAFESLALMRASSTNLTGSGDPARLLAARISASTFDVLGVHPSIGRAFTEAEDRAGQDDVVILSHALWTERFHADPAIAGRKVLLDGRPHMVVGVMPKDFRLPSQSGMGTVVPEKTQIFRPLGYDNDDLRNRSGDMNWAVIARLRPGVEPATAQSELNVIQAGISKTLEEKMELRAAITPLHDAVVGDARRGLLVIMGAVAAVLIVLCVNLANLWFARAAGHSRETAIRVALGASRARLIRHMLTSSLLLSIAGGLLGIGLAYAGMGALLRLAPSGLPRLGEVHIDTVALAFSFGVSVVCGVLFGILPAFKIARQDPQEALKSGSHAMTESVHGVSVRKILVAAEVALSTVLLITAGLLVRTFDRLINVDRGFDVERVLATDVALPSTKYKDDRHRAEFFQRLVEKAQAMPGVVSASIVSALPLQGETWIDLAGVENDTRPMFQRPMTNVRFISPDYFRTIGATLRAGRTFDDSDRARLSAIISHSLADRLWPGQDPVGRVMLHNEKKVVIVGVTPDLHSTSLDKDPVNMLYIPFWQRPRLGASLLVRTANDPRGLTNAIRASVWALDGEVPVPEIRTLLDVMNKSVSARRFNMLLLTVFAVSALALASLGVYGVLAYSVTRRRNEIGIRMAIGADAQQVRSMVLWQGMQPVLFGLMAGAIASVAMGSVLRSLLFQVSARDPLTVAIVAAVLCAVSFAACIIPAIRATRVDPISALRCD